MAANKLNSGLKDPVAANKLHSGLKDPVAANKLNSGLKDPVDANKLNSGLKDPVAANKLNSGLKDPVAANWTWVIFVFWWKLMTGLDFGVLNDDVMFITFYYLLWNLTDAVALYKCCIKNGGCNSVCLLTFKLHVYYSMMELNLQAGSSMSNEYIA